MSGKNINQNVKKGTLKTGVVSKAQSAKDGDRKKTRKKRGSLQHLLDTRTPARRALDSLKPAPAEVEEPVKDSIFDQPGYFTALARENAGRQHYLP